MPIFDAYAGLSWGEQYLHFVHFMLCTFAVIIACIPLTTEKGSAEHKVAGKIYLPVSMVTLLLATWMAWNEASLVLFCFNVFCAYLLLSGWRAVHEEEMPRRIDWFIPGTLALLALGIAAHALIIDEGKRSFFLLFFSLNAFYLAWRDGRNLILRTYWCKRKIFFAGQLYGKMQGRQPEAWINRHVAGMVGSMIANLSVIVLTLLPLWLHWLWPVTLAGVSLYAGLKQRHKRITARKALAAVLQPKFRRDDFLRDDDDERPIIRRAA